MSFTAPAFIDDLKTKLEARTGITDLTPAVTVYAYWPSPDESTTDAVILGFQALDNNEQATMRSNRSHEETVDLQCRITILRPSAGEAPAKAARDRAETILNEIDTQLREDHPDVGDFTHQVKIANRDMRQFPDQAGSTSVRVCVVDFTIQYAARTT